MASLSNSILVGQNLAQLELELIEIQVDSVSSGWNLESKELRSATNSLMENDDRTGLRPDKIAKESKSDQSKPSTKWSPKKAST